MASSGTRVHSIDAIAEITTLQSAKLTKNEIGSHTSLLYLSRTVIYFQEI